MSGIDSDLIRGHIDTIILKTLFDGDKYGYEILDEVAKKSAGAYELKQPTLYSCLKRLETQGLISSYWVDSEIGGKRHYYCLTEQGKETYKENQQNWLRSRQIIDNLIWEDAPVVEQKQISNYDNVSNDNIENANFEPVIDYIPPTQLHDTEIENTENTNESVDDNKEETIESNSDDDNSTLLDLLSDNIETDQSKEISSEEETNSEIEVNNTNDNTENYEVSLENTIVESEQSSDDDIDIMSLLGHVPQEQSKNDIENKIEQLNEASDNLNEITEDYSTNSFLENFVKNYMTQEEVPETTLEENEVSNNQEDIIDDFNLDISKHFSSDDSYFSSTDSKDKIDFITPNVVIDNLKTESEINEPSHIEFIDDENDIYNQNTTETNEETVEEQTITPTYVSFGEEIVRSHEEDNSIYNETYNNYLTENTSDEDSLYVSPEENNIQNFENFESEESNTFEEISNDTPSIFNDVEETKYEVEEVKSYQNEETYNQVYKPQAQGFEVIPSKYTDVDSKKKITELTAFAKESSIAEEEVKSDNVSFDTHDFLERNKTTKNYDKLIADFEQEGLSVRVHSRLVKEDKDSRTYIETNKIKMTRNWISFCLISAILAIVFAVMQSSGVSYYAFSYKYFIIGILIAMIVPIISTIIFALNPYRKHVASFSPSASFMLSALVFVQLLLIIYCVNLQLGFYSFHQEYYNHLYWIIPSIISIYPVLNSIVYTTLYKSKNFHS